MSPLRRFRATHVALALVSWLHLSGATAAQQDPAGSPASASGTPKQTVHTEQTSSAPPVSEYPSLHLSGFADVTF